MIWDPAYTIGVTSYRGRWEQFKELARSIELRFPDIAKVYYLNGHQDKNGQNEYLKKAMEFLYGTSTYFIIIPDTEPQGVAHMWNQIIQHAPTEKVWLLNDDIQIGEWIRGTVERVSLACELCTLAGSWSFFMISKKTVSLLGCFDEAYATIGCEDTDYYLRAFLSGQVTCNNVTQACWAHDYAPESDTAPSWDMQIINGKYAKGNRDYFEAKWDLSREGPSGDRVFVPVYDFYAKQRLPTHQWQIPYGTMLYTPPLNDESFDCHYGEVNWRGHRVLDLGGSYADFAYWVLQHGAVSVVSVESDWRLHATAHRYANKDPRVALVYDTIATGQQLSELIEQHAPTALKVDIEGAENALLQCDALNKLEEIAIEIHAICGAKEEEILRHIKRNGFKIKKATRWMPMVTMTNGQTWQAEGVSMYYCHKKGWFQ